MTRSPIIPREDLDHLNSREKILTLLSEQGDFVQVKTLTDFACADVQSILKMLRAMEKKGLVISKKSGDRQGAPVSFMLVGAQWNKK